jgi:dTDP-glucose 4,6-dehydratase
MKVLVTGGAGFQGSNLCRALLARGDQVTILNTYSERSQQNLERFDLQAATVVWGSITDAEIVAKTVRGHDLVMHLAANIHVDESRDKPGDYYRANVLGTLNVAEACREHDAPLFHVSTCEVYGAGSSITEDYPLNPQSPYAASKAGADRLAYAHAVTYGQRVLIVRPSNVYGPGQRYGTRGAVIPIFVKRALAGQPLIIYGDGSQSREFVYVEDLAQGYADLARQLVRNTRRLPCVLNLGSGATVTIRGLAELVIEATGSTSTIRHTSPRPGEVDTFRLDSTLARSYGINCASSFGGGLVAYADWFRTHELQEPAPCSV